MFERVDVLITPTSPRLPPKIGEDTVSLNGIEVSYLDHIIRFTGPCGFANSLPVGMKIVGPAYQEGQILNVAHAFEQLHP